MNQEPPFAIQVEPVEGCSLACHFCGISSIRDNGTEVGHGKNSAPYRFMSNDTAIIVAAEIARLKWNPRIEFAMHGEPSMHPNLSSLIREFRVRLPKHYLMVTSNGSGLMKLEKIKALFDAGLDTLALDDYKHAGFIPKIREFIKPKSFFDAISIFEYPDDKEGSPHKRFKGKRITFIHDISDNTTGTHQLTNQGGNSGPAEILHQRCAKPFRELSVRWDGNVALCCDDWKGQYKIGDANTMALDEIWNHPRFDAARRYLYQGDREALKPCNGCNVRTYRNGLLPDKMGKEDMPLADTHSAHAAKQAQNGTVFTIKLLKG